PTGTEAERVSDESTGAEAELTGNMPRGTEESPGPEAEPTGEELTGVAETPGTEAGRTAGEAEPKGTAGADQRGSPQSSEGGEAPAAEEPTDSEVKPRANGRRLPPVLARLPIARSTSDRGAGRKS